ncbi:MAG: DUF1415 domain-containing protein [Persicimonas sp.]
MPNAHQNTRKWLEEAVIGLNLCPFARSVVEDDAVRIAVNGATSFDAAIDAALDEVDRLLEASPDDIATTLIVTPDALGDFDDFLDAVAVLEELLRRAHADEIVQLAHFHPDYRFEGTEPDALENYTNRAPYPTIQLLRVAQVAEAIDSHPDPESIPDDNIERLEAMGREAVEALWRGWKS